MAQNNTQLSHQATSPVAIIDEATLKDRIYVIRGQQVMLSTDLAVIYGYEHKRFTEQIRNNSERFEDDFMFAISDSEISFLRTKYSAANINSKSRSNPYAFTEQGIYMLMTVLRGPLAIQQSKALIRLFKAMKDTLLFAQTPSDGTFLALANQASANTFAIEKLDNKIEDTRLALSDFMASFGQSPFEREYVLLQNQTLEASIAYQQIYGLAKHTVIIVDNYIGLKTLLNLRHVKKGIPIYIFSDNKAAGLNKKEFSDFQKDYPHLNIEFYKTRAAFHDRFIIGFCLSR